MLRNAILFLLIIVIQGCGGGSFVDTLPTRPAIATQQPSVVSAKGATLSGVVNPMGNNVEVWFEWGAEDTSSNSTEAIPLGNKTQDIAVRYPLDGLLVPKTAYHYRIVVKMLDDNEVIKGEQEQIFTTPPVPAPTVMTVAQADAGSADPLGRCEFHATVNPNGFSAEGWFEWGLDDNYANQTDRQKMGSSSEDIDLAGSIEQDPLASGGTTYHYRAVAENEGGRTVGDDAQCTTAVDTVIDDPTLDSDGDGLNNDEEINTYHTDPLKADSDADGLSDSEEIITYGSDPLNPDSDGDGLTDGDEVNNFHTDPLLADTDGDGLSDSSEINSYHTDPTLSDTDGDTLSDGDEINISKTDPAVADTDNDGLSDGDEVKTYSTNPLIADSDGDGLSDGEEVITLHTDPLAQDSDGDGLTDGVEVNTHGTDPNKSDTDGDTVQDGFEITAGSDPLDPNSTPPDLVVTLIDGPGNAALGQDIAVSSTVQNRGGMNASNIVVDLYLSANGVLPDGDDIYLGSYSLANLAAGQASTGNSSLTLPATLAAGVYALGAVVDAHNAIIETQEANNSLLAAQTLSINNSLNIGDGSDGNLTLASGTFNLFTDSSDALGNSDDDNPGQPDGFATNLTASVSAGATKLPVSSTAGFVSGDEVLIIQMSHATNHGVYEFIPNITVKNASTLSFATGLTHSYFVADSTTDRVQVVRVPHYATLSIQTGATLTTGAYSHANGVGGVIALRAVTLTVDGGINADELGFAGGPTVTVMASAGYQGRSYTGVTPVKVVDPNQGGGGGGLYNGSYGAAGGGYGENAPSTILSTGGQAYGSADLARLYLGSGGGSGGTDDKYPVSVTGVGGAGGAGGGIVYLAAESVSGGGEISAVGGAGVDYAASLVSAPGGGGSGGTVRAQASTWSMTINVSGGAGGVGKETRHNATGGAIGRDAVSIGAPDLLITDITSPATAARGETISVTSTVLNQELDAATAPFKVGIYASPDPVITANDVFLGDYSLSGLSGNTSQATPIDVVIPADLYSDPPAGYQYRKKISIDPDKVSGDGVLEDFPLLIDIVDPDLRSSANGGKVQNADAYDIMFTDITGSALAYELETYDAATGHFRGWVRVPRLSGSVNTDIYLYYGNSAVVAPATNTPDAWNGHYQAVFHQDEIPGASAQLDSTGHGNNAANVNMAGAQNVVDAVVGKGISFDGIDDYQRTQASVLDTGSGDWSLETWVKLDTLNPGKNYLVQTDDNPLGQGLLYVDSSDGKLYSEQGSQTYTAGQILLPGSWHQLVLVRDHLNDNLKWYVDGAWMATSANVANASNNGRWLFGISKDGSTGALSGGLDELRVSEAQLSPEWIKTGYVNMSSPSTFYSLAAEEDAASFATSRPFYLGAIADYTHAVTERDEFNNADVQQGGAGVPLAITISN